MREEILLEIELLYCSCQKKKKKSKNSKTRSWDAILWNRIGEKRGWKRAQRCVSWGGGLMPWDWLALRVEDARAPRRCKWVHYNQRESCDGVFRGPNEPKPHSTAVRGTAGSVKVNKPVLNTTRQGAARKRAPASVGSSGMMWLCLLSAPLSFSAPGLGNRWNSPFDELKILLIWIFIWNHVTTTIPMLFAWNVVAASINSFAFCW